MDWEQLKRSQWGLPIVGLAIVIIVPVGIAALWAAIWPQAQPTAMVTPASRAPASETPDPYWSPDPRYSATARPTPKSKSPRRNAQQEKEADSRTVTGSQDVEKLAIRWWNRMTYRAQITVCEEYGRNRALVQEVFEEELPDWDGDGTMTAEWYAMEDTIVWSCPEGMFP